MFPVHHQQYHQPNKREKANGAVPHKEVRVQPDCSGDRKNEREKREGVLIALSCSTGWGVLFDFGFQFHATALFSLIQT